MNELITADNFLQIRQIGLVLAFTICTIIQILSPHHENIKNDFKNWRINLPTALLNGVLLSFLLAGIMLNASMIVTENQFGVLQYIPSQLGQIIFSVLVLDLTAYLWHIANHKINILMRFHAVHHSDINFDTSTAVRFHIGEIAISFLIRFIVVIIFGIPLAGLLAFELIYQFFNFFEHGNIKLAQKFERQMEKIFITPALHRKHHSQVPVELNSNYGTIFSFWDKLGRTKTLSESSEKFLLGLPNQKHDWSLREVLFKPFGF